MAAENIITGRTGRFVWNTNEVTRLTQFSVNPTLATSSEWGDSDGAGYTNRAEGRRDATFTAEGKYDLLNGIFLVIRPGLCESAVLWMRNDTASYWAFERALCTDFNLVVDVDTEEVVGWSASFGADGQFSGPGEAATFSVGSYPT